MLLAFMFAPVLSAFASELAYISNGETIAPYTPAIKAGRTLYLSGQIALTPKITDLATIDFEVQTRQVMENLIELLKKADYAISDLVQCTVYLKDMRDYAAFNRIYGSYFEKGKAPTRVAIEISNLPRNAKIEISAIAYK